LGCVYTSGTYNSTDSTSEALRQPITKTKPNPNPNPNPNCSNHANHTNPTKPY